MNPTTHRLRTTVKNKKRNAISLSRCRACRSDAPTLALVTLEGLEPATSPAPRRTRTLYPPLSYSVVTIFMTVCGGARAYGQSPY
jgi:hypothetical protein